MDSDLHFVLVTTGTELRACPQGTSVIDCKAPPLLISNMKRPRPSRDATRVPSPVVVLVSRLLFGRRSVMSEGAARGGGRATRTRRARRAYIAGGSHRRSSAGTSHAAVVLSSSLVPSPVVVLVSRLLFGRRSVLSEGAARGGSDGRRARGARDARTSRVVLTAAAQPGHRAPRWSSPLLSSRRRSSSSSRVFSSVAAPC